VALPGYQSVSVTDSQLLAVPAAAQTYGQGITKAGEIVGSFIDSAGASHGYIATPITNNGKK
jgi:hypothetical protein